jgi:hypothetical protein
MKSETTTIGMTARWPDLSNLPADQMTATSVATTEELQAEFRKVIACGFSIFNSGGRMRFSFRVSPESSPDGRHLPMSDKPIAFTIAG